MKILQLDVVYEGLARDYSDTDILYSGRLDTIGACSLASVLFLHCLNEECLAVEGRDVLNWPLRLRPLETYRYVACGPIRTSVRKIT